MWIILCEMWINLASLKCTIPDCKHPAEEKIKRMSNECIESVNHSSIKREDKFNERLNSFKGEGVIIACHRSCFSSDTSQHHVDRYNRKGKQVEEKDN